MTIIIILLVLIQSTLVTLCLLALKLAKLLQQINNEEIAEIKKNVRKIPIAKFQVFKDSEIKR